jgi:hypothetical protein
VSIDTSIEIRIETGVVQNKDDIGGCAYSCGDTPSAWTRESEASLVSSLVDAVAQQRAPHSRGEADVYRFSSQLLMTRYRDAGNFLNGAARDFYARAKVTPRSFPQVVADGLVSDVSRLRHLLENRMAGIHSW